MHAPIDWFDILTCYSFYNSFLLQLYSYFYHGIIQTYSIRVIQLSNVKFSRINKMLDLKLTNKQ
jgi:hypothetical protein